MRAESKQPATQGEVVDYAYDALGRLLTSTHRGALPSGSLDETRRPFKAQRGYLWDGDTLLAETSYNFDGAIVSRKDHVPGPGPDQTYQIKADGRTFSLFKDEQGNPIGLLEETGSGKANLLARFLYTPYGDLHLEAGPEMRKAEFKTGRASLGPVDQALDPLTVTGSLELTTTIALAPTSYDALKVETFDAGTSTWIDVPRGELTLGVDTNPELLILFRTAGWKKNNRYRFRVTTGLKDDFGRNLQLPDDVAVELQIPLDVIDTAPIYIRSFKLGYDTAKAAANELGGAFVGGLSLGFTGSVADPFSGLLYLRNRWYDPASGTWLSQDPMEDRDSPNLYGFVGARPHERTDPLGLQSAPGSVGRELELIEQTHELERQQREAEKYTSVGSILNDAFVDPVKRFFGKYEEAPERARAAGKAFWRYDPGTTLEQREVGGDYGAEAAKRLSETAGDITSGAAAITLKVGQAALETEAGGRAFRTAEEIAAARRVQIAKNAAAGARFEKEVVSVVKQANVDVAEQVTIKTRSGVKTRIDVAARSPETGGVLLKEAKASATAPLRRNQRAAFPEIKESGGVVVGKGKPGFPGGTEIPPTDVDVVRPPNVD